MAKQPKAMKKYFKEVKKHLLCSWSEKNGFVSFIQDQLDHEILNDQRTFKEKDFLLFDVCCCCYGRNVDKKVLEVVQVCSGKY